MASHWKALIVLSLSAVVAFALGIVWSPYVGFAVLVAGIVFLYMISVAWMQPRGPDETHGSDEVSSAER